jgi:predicted nucleic acid-binding protein
MFVLDTNVLVSGLLTANSPPSQLLRLVTGGRERLAFDERILAEYRLVLGRPRFHVSPDEIDQLLEAIEHDGTAFVTIPLRIKLPDETDTMFIEVALAAGKLPIVTGNMRHFPKPTMHALGIEAVAPSAFLSRIAKRPA